MDAVEEQFRRMVFNIVGRNQDDHVKNIAFLMNKQGEWSLSPAFDMTYSFNPTGAFTSSHQMTLNLKQDNFVLDDFKKCAKTVSMKRGRAETIIDEVQAAVSRWQDYADEVGVLPEQRDKIQNVLRLDIRKL
jgi:serine/threonine-protein kinase HipA